MANSSDHDGKSATSAGADAAHYPEQNHNDGHSRSDHERTTESFRAEPSPVSIAVRAHEIWIAKGRPHGNAEEDWLEAEEELQAGAKSKSLIDEVHRKAGSVQA